MSINFELLFSKNITYCSYLAIIIITLIPLTEASARIHQAGTQIQIYTH